MLLVFAAASASADAVRYSYYGADASTYTVTTVIQPGGVPSSGPVYGDYRISGWVELDGPLAANLNNIDISNTLSSWAFDRNFDGGTLNSEDYQSNVDYFGGCYNACFNLTVSTDAQGNISEWFLAVKDNDFYAPSSGEGYSSRFSLTPSLPNGDSGTYFEQIWLGGGFTAYSDYTSASVGSWSATVVPIPGAAWLFVSALGLIGWHRRLG